MQDGSALLNFEKQWISNWEEQIEERKINDRKLRMYKVHNNEQRTNCIFLYLKSLNSVKLEVSSKLSDFHRLHI